MTTDANDAELLLRYTREGAEEAFAELVRRYLALVYHAAARQVGGDGHTAEDVTQKVFTLLARKAASLTRHSSLAGWLHTTTRLVAHDTLRAERRRCAREQEAYVMNELLNENGTEADWERLRPVIDEAVAELAERDREAVLLRFLAGLPLAQLGARLNVSENAARMRVERALERLRGGLERRGITSTSAALGLALSAQGAGGVPAGLAAAITNTALAGAAATAGAGACAGIIGFMSTSKAASMAAAAAALLAIGSAVHHVRGEHEAGAALTAARQRHSEMAARVDETARGLALLRQTIAAAQRTLAALPQATAAKLPADDPTDLGRAIMEANPGMKELLANAKRAGVAGRYYAFYRELGLTEDEIAAFEEIMISGISDTIRGFAAGLEAVRFEPAPKLQPEEKKRRLLELLGEGGVRRMQEYDAMQISYVSRVASALYFTDTPLTAEQGRRLGNTIAAQAANVVRGKTTPAEYWGPITEKARAFMLEPQLEALAGLQARDELAWARDQASRRTDAQKPTEGER